MSSHTLSKSAFGYRQVWISLFAILLITSVLSVVPAGLSGTLSRGDAIPSSILPSAPMNYSMTIAPTTVRVVKGGSVFLTVTITSTGGFHQPVALNSSEAPAGVSVYFAPPIVTPPMGGSVNSSITVNVLPTTAPGNYSIDVVSTSGSASLSATLTVQVLPPDFSIDCVPSPLIIQEGDTGRSVCRITSINNFNTTISFSGSTWVETPPALVTFSPPSDVWPPVNGTVSTLLIIYTSTAVPNGTFIFRVIGTGGGVTRTVDVSVEIEAGTRDFEITASPESLSIVPGTSATSTIAVQSIGVFSEPVELTLSGAPDGLTTSFGTNPVIPPGGEVAYSVLTLTAAGAPTGTNMITITGTSGNLSHTTTLTVQIASGGGACLIATATYGSELSSEVQFLRNFRDKSIMKTTSGSNFMIAFNAFYYSFSPTVAEFIRQHENARTIAKLALYPLMGTLRIGAAVFDLFPNNPEVAAVSAGVLVSALMGVVYLGLPLSGVLACSSRARRMAKKLQLPALAIMLASTLVIACAEALAMPSVLMVTTSTMVVATLVASGLLTSRTVQGFRSSIEKLRAEAKLPQRK